MQCDLNNGRQKIDYFAYTQKKEGDDPYYDICQVFYCEACLNHCCTATQRT